MSVLTVVAWNVRQGGGSRCPAIAAAIVGLGGDVVVISEHRSTGRGNLAAHLRDRGFVHQIGGEDPRDGHTGVLVASRHMIEAGQIRFDSAEDGHRLQHVVTKGWHLLACDIPGYRRGSDRKQRYWQFLVDGAAPTLVDKRAVVIGDLNTGLHHRDELRATLKCHEHMSALEASGWRDAWGELHPDERPPGSWFSPKYGNPFRLDHALLSPAAPQALSISYRTGLSDGTVL